MKKKKRILSGKEPKASEKKLPETNPFSNPNLFFPREEWFHNQAKVNLRIENGFVSVPINELEKIFDFSQNEGQKTIKMELMVDDPMTKLTGVFKSGFFCANDKYGHIEILLPEGSVISRNPLWLRLI